METPLRRTMQESWVGKFGTSVVSMNEWIQRDPVAALPALYLSTHAVGGLISHLTSDIQRERSAIQKSAGARFACHLPNLQINEPDELSARLGYTGKRTVKIAPPV